MISKSCPPSSLSACHCVHGQCDSGLLGTGHCRPDSCHLGHQGQDCNIGKCKKMGYLWHLAVHKRPVLSDINTLIEMPWGSQGNDWSSLLWWRDDPRSRWWVLSMLIPKGSWVIKEHCIMIVQTTVWEVLVPKGKRFIVTFWLDVGWEVLECKTARILV